MKPSYKGTSCNAEPTYATPLKYGCNQINPIVNPTPVAYVPSLFNYIKLDPNTPKQFIVNQNVIPSNSYQANVFDSPYKKLDSYNECK